MSVANFSYVLSIITKFYDCYTGKKEEAITWSRRFVICLLEELVEDFSLFFVFL